MIKPALGEKVSAPPESEPGDALLGRQIGPYRIEQRVGTGGMGHVYRALEKVGAHLGVAERRRCLDRTGANCRRQAGERQTRTVLEPRPFPAEGWSADALLQGWPEPEHLVGHGAHLRGWWQDVGPIKNKPIQLANGDILCPSSTEHDGWRVHFERSSDGGRTWKATPALNDGKEISAIQPSILIHKDGRLQALGWTRQGKLFEIWSDDRGRTWSKMLLTGLPNPNSGIDAVAIIPPGDVLRSTSRCRPTARYGRRQPFWRASRVSTVTLP